MWRSGGHYCRPGRPMGIPVRHRGDQTGECFSPDPPKTLHRRGDQMRKRFNTSKAVIRVIAIAAAGSLCGIASAQITGVAEGADYLQTNKPTRGRGNPAPIVRRKKQPSFTTAEAGPVPAVTIPIQIEALNLQGTLGSCTVTITLAPTPASTGTMMINVTSATGGTFYSK